MVSHSMRQLDAVLSFPCAAVPASNTQGTDGTESSYYATWHPSDASSGADTPATASQPPRRAACPPGPNRAKMIGLVGFRLGRP